MVFISSGTPWVDRLVVGIFGLVAGLYLWIAPSGSYAVCGPWFVVLGIPFLVDGLWNGWAVGWLLGTELEAGKQAEARGGDVVDDELAREVRTRQGDESEAEEKDY